MNTIELTSSIDKSGRLAVCQNETIVYKCRSVDYLAWNVEREEPILFVTSDTSNQFVDRGQFFAYLQNNSTMDDSTTDNSLLSSYLAILYIPDWNNRTVQCMNLEVRKDLLYIIAGN